MTVETKHPEYVAHAPKWQRMRDVIDGQDAVHAAGDRYLPRLKDQSEADYKAYKLRATWYGATCRTIDFSHGLLFRKPPSVEAPAAMADILDDVTMGGVTAEAFAAELAREVLEVGKAGLLVDFPPVVEQPSSAGQAKSYGLRPFATRYTAESVINWRCARIGNRMMLTLVVLAETHHEPKDEFEDTLIEQLRVLRLRDGTYTQEIWRKGKLGWAVAVPESAPKMNGAPMNFVPFLFVGPEHTGPESSDPPLLDMADINLSHYRTSADLEHGAHLTGLPMLFISGVHLGDGEKVALGSQTALVTPNADARASYAEFTGQGLQALETRLERKEAQMAALGASMLAPQKKAVEAADTHELRAAHDTSMLADVSTVVSSAMTKCLEWLRDWAGISGDVSMELSTDFAVTRMTAQELTALLAAWQGGGISRATLYWNLQQGEMVQDGKTVEEEQAEIDAEGPKLGLTGEPQL
jgi:hypothetical protein